MRHWSAAKKSDSVLLGAVGGNDRTEQLVPAATGQETGSRFAEDSEKDLVYFATSPGGAV